MPIYLDNAATSHPKPESVYQAVDHALREIGTSPGRGGYRRGLDATRIIFDAREKLAELFGIHDSARLVFTGSATEALNLAIAGMLRPGDHAVTTTMEHNSVSRPLRVAETRGASVTRIPCDRSGFLNPRDLADALRPDTRLIVLSHCSNVTGTIQPIAEIGRLANRAGVTLLVDAAQSAGIIPIDVKAMGINLLAAPGHKGLLGPQGTGFLYIGEGLELPPLLVGGTGGHSSDEEQPEEMPARFESGTLNTPGIAGLRAGVEFILTTGSETIRKKELSLVRHLLEGLAGMKEIALHGPAPEKDRGGIVSFTIEGRDPAMIGFTLDQQYDIEVRTGLHCAPWAHRTIGTYPAGTIRVSPGWFTTETEIETFLRAMRQIIMS
ncbi:MAG: aminotransferase class V-fold PLP-dependent enzyme [Deltaproteobacteria bacterium]|nr:aminotransferase class V-fold PLP-dependent enzyme [Deltaproteobacteria bacterium]TLN02764.1 MAG: aminotransferase class V-fold PLP-dependent enzyme [bacterium]